MKIPMRALTLIALCATSLFFSLNSFGTEKLRFIGDQNIPTGEKFKETEIGGLSGVAYDKDKKRLLAISDDRGMVNEARFYEFSLTLDDKTFKVSPEEVVVLKDKEGKPFKKGTIDFEGITLLGGDIFISSEGALNKDPILNAEVFQFNRQGIYKSNLEIPEQFIVTKNISKYGARENLVFEGLSLFKLSISIE